MKKFYKRAWAEIHLDRLKNNLEICNSFLSNKTEMLAVVKANAYGHDDKSISLHLQSLGVNWFAVSNISEAIHLRQCGITKEILILGYVCPTEAIELCEHNLNQTVTSLEHANALSVNTPIGKKLRVHIKIDTGMGRIGLKHNTVEEYVDEISQICSIDNLSVEGIFSHFAVADSDNNDDISYTNSQKELLISIKSACDEKDLNIKHIHFLNSAGATYHENDDSTLARYGIMLYGMHQNFSLKLPKPLLPVMELKSIVSHVKTLGEGDYVSYGRTYRAEKSLKVATLPIGYADGYSRLLSSKADVLINGKRAKVIGRVCMDQIMIDVSDIDVNVGNVATLFGIDGDEQITADEIADIYGTIGYEVVCGISKRVPRLIYQDGVLKDILEY